MINSKQRTDEVARMQETDPFFNENVIMPPDFNKMPDTSWTDPKFTRVDSDPQKSLPELMAEAFSKTDDDEVRKAVGAYEVDNGEVYVDGQKVLWSRKGGSYQARMNGMRYTSDTKDGLFSMLAKSVAKPWRELNDSESLQVARLAASQQIGPAIQLYLSLALRPGTSPEQAVHDSRYAELCDRVAWHVFVNATPDYQPSEEAQRFIFDYCGNRPLNVGLLQVAWRAYSRADMLGHIPTDGKDSDAPPTREELENLSDTEFEQLRLAVLKERAASGRR